MKQTRISNIQGYSICVLIFLLSFFAVVRGNAQEEDTAYRAELIRMIVDKWQDTSAETGSERWRQGITVWLERLDTDELTAALDISTYADLRSMLVSAGPSADQTEELDTILAIGKSYYPLEPCRIVDTRTASYIYAGPISSDTVANYFARDSTDQTDNIALQGGKPGGCGVPAAAEAVVVNITATEQGGRGHLRAYPWGIAMPRASIVNFSGSTIANATILPICTVACSYDFSIYASMTTEVLVDVMGYFAD
jgi:hypothetical protein